MCRNCYKLKLFNFQFPGINISAKARFTHGKTMVTIKICDKMITNILNVYFTYNIVHFDITTAICENYKLFIYSHLNGKFII